MPEVTRTREQLLRRAAQGEDVSAEIYKLDDAKAADEKEQALHKEIALARGTLNRETAKVALQSEYDKSVDTFNAANAAANKAADAADKAIADAKQALLIWQQATATAQQAATVAHHLQMQGATPVRLPHPPGWADITVHLIRRVGDGPYQQLIHHGLPRAS